MSLQTAPSLIKLKNPSPLCTHGCPVLSAAPKKYFVEKGLIGIILNVRLWDNDASTSLLNSDNLPKRGGFRPTRKFDELAKIIQHITL